MNRFVEWSMKKYFLLRKTQNNNREDVLQRQKRLLKKIIQENKKTQFGLDNNFSTIHSYTDWKNKLPVKRYEDFAPYIKKMLDGQNQVLCRSKVTMFSKSSGTTGDRSKYLPVTRESLKYNHYKAGRDIYSYYFQQFPESELFENKGSVLSLGGSLETNKHGILVGDVSALIMNELPVWAERYRSPSIETALMKTWEEKIPAIISDAKDDNVTHLAGVPTWFVPLLEELLEKEKVDTITDIWPHLELFIHGAVAFDPYVPVFKKLLPKSARYLEVYNASEGFFAVQDENNIKEMLLLTDHGIFYEFIAMDEYRDGVMNSIRINDVVCGIEYAVIITTLSGLYRYDLGDTVVFTSLDPYRIKITGRTKQFINLCGEELMVMNAEEAIAKVCSQHNCTVEQFTVAPRFATENTRACHEWLVEFKEQPKDREKFKVDLDNMLRKLNSDYDAKRTGDIALDMISFIVAQSGTFMQWMEKKNKLGGQHKVPRLSQDRKCIEELIKLNKS